MGKKLKENANHIFTVVVITTHGREDIYGTKTTYKNVGGSGFIDCNRICITFCSPLSNAARRFGECSQFGTAYHFAIRWGGKWGVITCMAYGIIDFLLGFKFSLHFLSILLDYILGYGAIGVAGFFGNSRVRAIWGVTAGCALRWVCSVVSGAVVFASYAPAGQNPWIYSMIYNASYMVPELVINMAVIVLFYNRIMKGIRSARG